MFGFFPRNAPITPPLWLASVWLCLCLIASSAAAQHDEEAYRALVDRALVELRLQHWSEARVLFSEAHAVLPSAQTLRALGTTAFELRLYTRALNELEAALQHPVRPLDPEQREQVSRLASQARSFVAQATITGVPVDGKLALDGSEIVLPGDLTIVLDPGEHELQVTFGDGSLWQRALTVVSGQRTTLHVQDGKAATELALPTAEPAQLEPAQAEATRIKTLRRRRRNWGIGLLSAALGTASAAGGLGFATLRQSDAVESCKPDCAPSEATRGRRLQYATNGLAAVSAALALSGAWVWLSAPRAVSIEVALANDTALGQLQLQF